jgi:hypothetical protein
MDILNALYLKAQGLIRTSAEPNSIVYLSTPDPRRDDKYLTIGVPIENLAAVIGALQTVAVDGVTITGDGTPGNPLTVNIAGTGLVDSVTADGIGWITVDNTDPENPIVGFAGIEVDGVTITGTGLAGDPLVAAGLPYLEYTALLIQTGTDDPTVVTLGSNTLGITPIFARTSAGVYTITSTGSFTVDKTRFDGNDKYVTFAFGAIAAHFEYQLTYNNVNQLSIYTYNNATGTLVDDAFVDKGLWIEIRVYP